MISDQLNHASIIDGIRLCKAKRYRYSNNDMDDLRARLDEATAAGIRCIMIATDGVFSMDGIVAKIDKICDLADEYGAMVMVDDSHATGFFGPTGRGSVEHCGVLGRVDVITLTLGKALGGATGGFSTGRAEIIDLLRQRSRPYLFSNTLAPAVVGAAIKAFDMMQSSRRSWPTSSSMRGSTSSDSSIPSCPRDRPVFAVRCPRLIRGSTSTRR